MFIFPVQKAVWLSLASVPPPSGVNRGRKAWRAGGVSTCGRSAARTACGRRPGKRGFQSETLTRTTVQGAKLIFSHQAREQCSVLGKKMYRLTSGSCFDGLSLPRAKFQNWKVCWGCVHSSSSLRTLSFKIDYASSFRFRFGFHVSMCGAYDKLTDSSLHTHLVSKMLPAPQPLVSARVSFLLWALFICWLLTPSPVSSTTVQIDGRPSLWGLFNIIYLVIVPISSVCIYPTSLGFLFQTRGKHDTFIF